MTTTEKIEMTRRNLMSVTGYSFNETKLAEACANDFIPNGEFVMANGDEKVYFENETFVTKKNGQVVKSFSKLALNEVQQNQLFCIWAGNQAKN